MMGWVSPACLAILVSCEGHGFPEAFSRAADFTSRLAIPWPYVVAAPSRITASATPVAQCRRVCGVRTLARSVRTLANTCAAVTKTRSHECERCTHECVRHNL